MITNEEIGLWLAGLFTAMLKYRAAHLLSERRKEFPGGEFPGGDAAGFDEHAGPALTEAFDGLLETFPEPLKSRLATGEMREELMRCVQLN